MADFNQAIPVILKHEGGWVDDPNDKGGATNWGISLRFAKTLGLMLDIDGDGDVDADDIRKLPLEKAVEVYRTKWWEAFGYGSLKDQLVATKIFDMAINMGPGVAHALVQKGCNACGGALKVDGNLGPLSKGVVDSLDATKLLLAIRQEQLRFYEAIVTRDPTQGKFMRSWSRRANWPLLAV